MCSVHTALTRSRERQTTGLAIAHFLETAAMTDYTKFYPLSDGTIVHHVNVPWIPKPPPFEHIPKPCVICGAPRPEKATKYCREHARMMHDAHRELAGRKCKMCRTTLPSGRSYCDKCRAIRNSAGVHRRKPGKTCAFCNKPLIYDRSIGIREVKYCTEHRELGYAARVKAGKERYKAKVQEALRLLNARNQAGKSQSQCSD